MGKRKKKTELEKLLQPKLLKSTKDLNKALYAYYLSLGPNRNLKAVWDKWKAYIGFGSLQRVALMQDWWTKGWEHDGRQLEEVTRKLEDRNRRLTQLVLQGVDAALAKAFTIGPDGKVHSRLDVKSWDDLAKLIRINDYLAEKSTGRDQRDLSDVNAYQNNYHMAIVNTIQQCEADYVNSEKLRDPRWVEDTRRIPKIDSGQIVEGHASVQDPGREKKDSKPRPK